MHCVLEFTSLSHSTTKIIFFKKYFESRSEKIGIILIFGTFVECLYTKYINFAVSWKLYFFSAKKILSFISIKQLLRDITCRNLTKLC